MKLKLLVLVVMGVILSTNPMDTSHFYRAHPWYGEPRFEEKLLTSFYFMVFGGSTRCCYDGCGQKTSLLNLYGPQKLQFLGSGVTLKDPSNPLDKILIDLAALPERPDFGSLAFSGNFSLWEGQFDIYQNFDRGFFFHLNIPVRALFLDAIKYKDLSPDDNEFPNRSTPVWQDFLRSFDDILARYGLHICPYSKSDIGDVSLLMGWTVNYQDTCYLDFIDATFQIGVLTPSAKRYNIKHIFDLPTGYNHHPGISVIFDASFGLYEWLTLGYHSAGLFLFDKTQRLFMKTNAHTNGFIKLAKGKANVSPGTHWQIGTYLKADHFCGGLSIYLGYIFDMAERTHIVPCSTKKFDKTIVNTDSLLCGWRMHNMNIVIEYDFAREGRPNAPRLAFICNPILGGKRIFDNSTFGGYLSVDCSWYY